MFYNLGARQRYTSDSVKGLMIRKHGTIQSLYNTMAVVHGLDPVLSESN